MAFLGEGFDLGVSKRWRAENIHRDHGINYGLVARIINFQHDICAESFDGVEEYRARVEAEVTFALIQDDIVLLQVHGTASENAGARWNSQRGGVVANLHLIEKIAPCIAADNELEVDPLQTRREGVVNLMRRQKDAAAGIDANRIRQFEIVGFDRGPDLSARKFSGRRRVESRPTGDPGRRSFFQ